MNAKGLKSLGFQEVGRQLEQEKTEQKQQLRLVPLFGFDSLLSCRIYLFF